MAGKRGASRAVTVAGGPQGSHRVLGGDPKPCTKRYGQHTSVQGAVSYTSNTASSSSIARPWGRDGNSCWCRSGHSPLTVAAESVVSLKNHHTDHRVAGCNCRDCVCVREDMWAVVYRVVDGTECKTECAIVLYSDPLEIEVCEGVCLADPECTLRLKKMVGEPPAIVGLGLCSHFIDSPFTALELNALKRDW